MKSSYKHFVKDFFIGAQEVREIIPFPVLIIPFPVLKISFGLASNS